MTVTLADRARGAIVGLALGDCLGAPFEGQPIVWPDEVHTLRSGRGSLRYTDDTAMAIDVAEWLISDAGATASNANLLAARFAATFRAEPWRGYGGGARALLSAIADGGDWQVLAPEMFGGAGSWGNGAAMRVAPVGVSHAGQPARAIATAQITASVTHAHPIGQAAAASIAAAVSALVGGAAPSTAATAARVAATAPDLRTAIERVEAVSPTDATTITQEFGNGVAAVEAVPAALAAFLSSPDDPWSIIKTAICVGGDTDTIAAMAGALAGARNGYAALPPDLVARVESVERLVDLADRVVSAQ